MAWRKQREPVNIVLLLELFMIVCSICHCAVLPRHHNPCSNGVSNLTMRKTPTLSWGEGRSTAEVPQGILVIGRSFRQGAKETPNLNTSAKVDRNYQSDMGWTGAVNPQDQVYDRRSDNAAVERLMQIDPKVECTGDSMKLKVQDSQSTPGSLFFVDRGNRLTPLPISKLPPSCGYDLKTTLTDLVLVALYNGCFVALEEGRYVLPLLWWNLPLRMSCPVMTQSAAANPPMVSCHAAGMVLKMEWDVSVHNIKVKVSGQWEPLMKIAPKCGFSVVAHPEGVVITAPFSPCVAMKDGMLTLELSGQGDMKVSCPSQSPFLPVPTQDSPGMAGTSYPSAFPQNPKPSYPQYPQYPLPQPQGPYIPFYPDISTPPVPEPPVQYGQQTPPMAVPPAGPANHQFNPFPFYFWQSQPDGYLVEPSPTTQPDGYPVELSPTTQPDGYPVEPPQATQPTQGQVKLPYIYPFYNNLPHPMWKPAEQPEATNLGPVTQTPMSQGMPHFPFPYYPGPRVQASPPTQKPATSAANLFGGQENQPFNQRPYYPQPPPAASEASASEILQPSYPYYLPFWPEGHPTGPMPPNPNWDKLEPAYPQYSVPSQPHESPASSTLEPVQGPYYRYPFGPLVDGKWQPVQEPAYAKEPPVSASEGLARMPTIPQKKPDMSPFPQPGTSYNPLMQCPQSCPPGVSNCCPQIFFHQHLHHIVPSGIIGLGIPPFYLGHEYLTSFGSGMQPAYSPNPIKVTPTSDGQMVTPAPESSQILGNYWGSVGSQPNYFESQLAMESYQLPPDVSTGSTFLSYPNQPTEPEQSMQQYVLPYNANDPMLPYPQDAVHVKLNSNANSDTASTSRTIDGESLQSMLQYYLPNSQAVGDPRGQSPLADVKKPDLLGQPYLLSDFLQYLKQLHASKQNDMKAAELQRGTGNHQVHRDQSVSLDPQTVPYHMLQDPKMHVSSNLPTSKSKRVHHSKVPEQPKSPVRSNAYVLLQQGPPGSGPRKLAAPPQQEKSLGQSGSEVAPG